MSEANHGEPTSEVEEFRKILTDAGMEVIPSRSYELPAEYDLSVIVPTEQRFAQLTLKSFVSFLSFPIIADKFANHLQRKDWRTATAKKIRDAEPGDTGYEKAIRFDKFYTDNKMKRNKVGFLLTNLDMAAQSGLINSADKQKIVDKLSEQVKSTLPGEDGIDPWDGPTTPKKIQIVNEISDTVAELLTSFGKK